jgi:uncharacterized membrane protein YdjX (TVP38/TMEM64 family)
LARPADLDAPAIGATALWPAVLKAGALLLGLVAAALLLRHTGAGLLHAVRPGWQGAALLIVLGGAMTAAGLPRQVLAFAGGYTFGAPLGGALALAGQLLGCALDYAAAHGLAAGLAQRLLARPITQRLHRMLAAHPFTATLTLRLMPVSSNVTLNLLAGATRLNPRAFFTATVLGYLPQTIIFALLGSGTQVGRPTQLAIGLALFIAATALGAVLYLRTRRGALGARE